MKFDVETIKQNTDLLTLIGCDTALKKVASTKGGEYAGPCPFCGGRDRFRVWPNADQPGSTPSEAVLDDAFHQIMRDAPGRLIIATFASLISRVQQVVNAAQSHNRKIAITGRSMIENTEMARELGYLDIPDEMLLSLSDVGSLPPEEVIIMATGSQGEPMAVLKSLIENISYCSFIVIFNFYFKSSFISSYVFWQRDCKMIIFLVYFNFSS